MTWNGPWAVPKDQYKYNEDFVPMSYLYQYRRGHAIQKVRKCSYFLSYLFSSSHVRVSHTFDHHIKEEP